MTVSVLSIVGNPRPASRTHGLADVLSTEIARTTDGVVMPTVDLALLGGRVLDPEDAVVDAACADVCEATVLVVATPTYKATYSGLLKAFLDRLGSRALDDCRAVPVMLGGAPDHRLAVDVHLTPLLLELGASVPTRGLFVLESEVGDFPSFAKMWAESHNRELSD